MKCVKLYNNGGPEVLEVEEIAIPVPRPNEVVIKVENIAINYSEIQQRKGTYPFPVELPMTMGQWGVISGEVIGIGESVQSICINSKVMAQVPSGSYAEFVTVPAYLLIPLPEHVDRTAVTPLLTQGQTAYHALKTIGNIKQGDTVLIHAASGGLGNIAVQLAKAFGASKVIATASSKEKLDYALSIGADISINYSEPDWTEKVFEATDGKGVDLILETVGGQILKGSIEVLAPFGRLIYIGSASSQNSQWDNLDLINILPNKIVMGLHIAELLSSRPELVKEGLEMMFSLMMKNQLKPEIKYVFPLSDVKKAHELIETRQSLGTVVLKP
ncbi:NADPH:quinone reductase-like Zn-dependent oxidoreductase [Ureibacillus xyleni]|uniref:NADPH:quinone reductase-like Zn-dependent oxidoreductase n=1 Tax=Ureibacillus xyleni TaxID=614648 RepID=A0A285T2E8_9BACL|nr:zinc-binding dehydrogenase [Ureibacillus xyleni]SOC15504.1 NADPH:quinone reductase-like Zn-dependent oxidoreductase [Ureibacillus xyleni]